jgi:hypothetical protein
MSQFRENYMGQISKLFAVALLGVLVGVGAGSLVNAAGGKVRAGYGNGDNVITEGNVRCQQEGVQSVVAAFPSESGEGTLTVTISCENGPQF